MKKIGSNDRPILCEAVRALKSLPATAAAPASQRVRVQSRYIAFDKGVVPRIETRFAQVGSSRGKSLWRLDVDVPAGLVDPRAMIPCAERRVVSRKSIEGMAVSLRLDHFRPDHLCLKTFPARTARPRGRGVRTRRGTKLDPLIVFAPDERYIYWDQNYPWCCAGQINSNGVTSSGVLVGPRHVLAASHAIDWNAMWATFTADRYGDFNLGIANALGIWSYEMIGSVNTDNVDSDYVVIVLDQPLGNWLGWLGSETYDDDWDGSPYWSSLGYDNDLGIDYPTFQPDIILSQEDGGDMKAMTTTTGDFEHGHSGGPVFGWWESGPYAIGVVSAGGEGKNWVSGGVSMVHLIQKAQQETP
jgi:hypothetical protein